MDPNTGALIRKYSIAGISQRNSDVGSVASGDFEPARRHGDDSDH